MLCPSIFSQWQITFIHGCFRQYIFFRSSFSAHKIMLGLHGLAFKALCRLDLAHISSLMSSYLSSCFNQTSLLPENVLCFPTSHCHLWNFRQSLRPSLLATFSEAFAVLPRPVVIFPSTEHQEHVSTFLLSLTVYHLLRDPVPSRCSSSAYQAFAFHTRCSALVGRH